MGFAARQVHHTYADYLRTEQLSKVKHEYFDGEVYAMAGGTPAHAALAARIIRLLGNQLGKECEVYTSDLRILNETTGLATYADVCIVCGKVLHADRDPDAATNPKLVVEVTSKSTHAYDRGEKLVHYKQCASIEEVLIVAYDEARITVHRRERDRWSVLEEITGGTIQLVSIGAQLRIDDVYSGIPLGE